MDSRKQVFSILLAPLYLAVMDISVHSQIGGQTVFTAAAPTNIAPTPRLPSIHARLPRATQPFQLSQEKKNLHSVKDEPPTSHNQTSGCYRR
jgi:hypothetical protein